MSSELLSDVQSGGAI